MGEAEIIQLLGMVTSLNESAHSKDRRQYQYGRSNLITTQRFAKEFEGLCKLVGMVGQHIEHHEPEQLEFEVDDIRRLLGEYRLFIDYRDESGESFCGVKARPCLNEKTNETEQPKGPSPYERIKEICGMLEKDCRPTAETEILETLYDDLIHCVDCRFHSIETGTRDRRRINKRKNSTFFATMDADEYRYLDNPCTNKDVLAGFKNPKEADKEGKDDEDN